MADIKKMLSVNEIIALRTAASKGDATAFKTLYAENARLAKRANSRMAALEKAGFAYYAYDRAAGFLASEHDATRFTTSKKILSDAYDLAQNILEERTFLRAKTSTVTAQRAIRAQRIAAFEAMGIPLPAGKEDDVLRFLGHDTVQDALKIAGHRTGLSSELVENVINAFEATNLNERALNYIKERLDLFTSGEIAFDEVTDALSRET